MDKMVKVWNVQDEETEGVKGRKREISLATSRDLELVCSTPEAEERNDDICSSLGKDLHSSLVARP